MSHCSPLWYRSSKSAPRPEAGSRAAPGVKVETCDEGGGGVCETHDMGIYVCVRKSTEPLNILQSGQTMEKYPYCVGSGNWDPK